jgi:hypothetical protein
MGIDYGAGGDYSGNEGYADSMGGGSEHQDDPISDKGFDPDYDFEPTDMQNLAYATPWDKQGLTDLWEEYEAAGGGWDGWKHYTGNLVVDFFSNVIAWANSESPPADISTAVNNGELPPENFSMEEVDAMVDNNPSNPNGGGGDSATRTSPGEIDNANSIPENGGSGGVSGLFSPKALAKLGMNKLWNDEINADSPYEKALGEMGLKGANTASGILDDMASGEFQLPAWMQNISDKNFKNFTESTTRRGAGPGSTAYGQGSAAFNLSDQESATKYGFGMLGLSSDMALNPFNSLNANKNSEYSNLFGISGNSLIDQPNQKTDSPKWWETALDIGSDIYTTSSLLNR